MTTSWRSMTTAPCARTTARAPSPTAPTRGTPASSPASTSARPRGAAGPRLDPRRPLTPTGARRRPPPTHPGRRRAPPQRGHCPMRTTDHRTDTDPDAHPDVPPNPSTAPGSVPPSRACHGVAQRSRAEPRGEMASGQEGTAETSPAARPPACPPRPPPPRAPRGMGLFLRELALGYRSLLPAASPLRGEPPMTPTTQTHPDVHPGTPSVPPNPPTVPGSVPPSRACPGEARRSRTEPRGRDGQRPGRGAPQETTATHDGHAALARLHGMIELATPSPRGLNLDPSFLAWLSKLHFTRRGTPLLISHNGPTASGAIPTTRPGPRRGYRTWQARSECAAGERGMGSRLVTDARPRALLTPQAQPYP